MRRRISSRVVLVNFDRPKLKYYRHKPRSCSESGIEMDAPNDERAADATAFLENYYYNYFVN